MVLKAYINLFDFIRGVNSSSPQSSRALPGAMNDPGIMSNDDHDPYDSSSEDKQRIIIVANFLPLNAQQDNSGRWCFGFDEDSILLQLKDSISHDTDVFYVGSLTIDVEESKQEQVSLELLEEFKCLPIFIPSDIRKMYYNGFCKQYLWPLFHYMMPMNPAYGSHFDALLWRAYVAVNVKFTDKVIEVINNPGKDYVWIHDYHLMALPMLLRRRYYRFKLGFFLHSPFPPLEIYMTQPIGVHILKALLNSDLIGFQTYEYARHFLSCCSQMLGLEYEYKRGYIEIEYSGRKVNIKVLPAGIHMGRLHSSLNHPSSSTKVREIREQFKGKTLILGVDDMDIFKGIGLKLLAIEQLLQKRPSLQGELVVVQIVNPPRRTGRDIEEAKKETYLVAERINERFGFAGYKPVIIIDHPTPFYEKAAYYALAECCFVNAVRDGMNLVPYMYIAYRQGTPEMDEVLEIDSESLHTSALVISEFIGCSPSLSGAFRVNPWDIDAVSEALSSAIDMPITQKHLRHEIHFRHVSSHDVAYWARNFMQDLERSCMHHHANHCLGLGLSFGFRVTSFPLNFRKLSIEHVVSAYEETKGRAIFLDYDGTIVPQTSIVQSPSPELISVINDLCNDPLNTVFIVSGRGKTQLSDWFDSCENLGIAAEHGYFIRWDKNSSWETSDLVADFSWKSVVEPEMRSYSELTGSSYMESKESGLVWHYHEDDSFGSDYGNFEAKELLDHLEGVLANEPAVVQKGRDIVEVKPQGITKGLVIEKVLSNLKMNGMSVDFVLCIGDDGSDEDMFASLSSQAHHGVLSPEADIFTCTVEVKSSKAMYFLNDPTEVMRLLQALAASGSESKKLMRENIPSRRSEVRLEGDA
ncbi:probable alpha,alpha-trehalose-phosphate synthase [UDP-forming] 9 [Neltuma alba]|uniref:probable alpha,alpha-trehalose-phosphate synthase [UDP-forming] 9 n=1 Tax=Neltuma alba TaxID=207710 RepID=UPI0010A4F966|nr:probable alpha,alpha-trehalose-phosphate synthase [UDP-forming] 9 [Prosopis alba]